MALIIKDRVKEGTVTTGTGDITLAGAPVRFAPFNSFMVDGDTTYYAIVHTDTGIDEWEVGLGTWNTGNTLSRTTVLAGTNGTSPVNFSTGAKDVFMTYPAAKALYFDASGNVTLGGDLAVGGDVVASGNASIDGYVDLTAIAHPAHQEGRIYYDNVHKALAYNTDVSGVELNIGQEEWIRVYNNTGATIDAGKPVYWSGNSNGVPTIGLGNGTEESKYNVQGLTTASIANGAYGYVTISGVVRNIDTSGLNAGQNVFLGLSDGALQNASPTYPNFPMCIGWVISSDATEGAILVNQQNHSVNSFRVRTDAHVAGNMIVGGDLTVLGSQTIASSSNISIANAWNYFNSGDTIGALNTSFTGSGLNDASLTGHFTGPSTTTYYVQIDGVGTGTGGVDTFKVSRDNFVTTDSSGNDIDGTDQLIHSLDNIAIQFQATTGHTLGDTWTGTASPINVDTGFATNRNTGTTGIGYTHMGIFFDVSAGKWVIFDEYDPEPEGTINTADASFSYGSIKGDTFEGNLLGNVTGNVSGNVSGSLTGNSAGTHTGPVVGNVTGNADTATKLATARTVQLSGDVTGSASFDGTANINIIATVQDDSHAHVISNVDGLQAALDAKADKTTTVSAGTGITGGGDLSVNRTLSLDTTYTDGRYVNVTGDTMTGSLDFGDNIKATFGASSDLQIYHDGSHSYIDDAGTGNLYIRSTNFRINNAGDTQQMFAANDGGSVQLFNNGQLKLATTATGVDVTGNVTVSGTVDGRDVATDGTKLDGIEAGATADQTKADIDALGIAASTAATLATARNIALTGDVTGSANFDGSANISITATVANDSHNHTDATLDMHFGRETQNIDSYNPDSYWATSKATGGSGTYPNNYVNVYNFAGNGSTEGTQLATYYGNNNNTWIRSRTDSSSTWLGWTQIFTDDYHPNADKLTTARNIALTGDVTGSANFDGSANISITATVADDSHNHTIANVDGLQTALDGKLDLSGGTMTGGLTFGAGVTLTEATDRADLLLITSSTAGWAGIQIQNTSNEGLWSFMTDGTTGGIYDDMSDAWHIQFIDGGETRLYYAGAEKLNTLTGGVYVTGDFTASGNVTAYSDERLKTNIQTLDGALDKVKQLRGVSFEKDGRQDIGVIAQEVQAVVPEVVDTTHEYLSVAYGNMVGLLIEAIKEQQQQIDDLKAKLEAK